MALTQQQALQEQIRLQTEFIRLQEESKRLADELVAAGDAATQAQIDALAVAERVEREGQTALDTAKQRTKEFDTIRKKSEAAFRSFARLSGDVSANLGSITNSSNVYLNVQREIIKLEEERAGLDEAGIEAVEARAAFLREISQSQLSQAQATAKAKEDAKGLNEFEAKRNEILANSLGLSDEQKKMALETIDATENAFKKEQRILSIKESQKSLYDAAPESLKSSVGFAKKLGDTLKTAGAGAVVFMLLAAVITAAVASFTALDSAAKEFRTTTGLTNSQMEGIKSDANEIVGDFAAMGVEAKNVFDTVASLKSEFSDTTDFSKDTVAALTLMNTNFGVAAEDAAKVQGIMEQVGGLSSETAASVGMQVVNLAKAAKVAPAKVMKDIAENAEAASTFFKGNVELLAKQAVEARRLGTNLSAVTKTAEKLLDFEGSIEEELVAATFVGGQFNLSQARSLAIQGDLVGAQKETLRQIQRSGDFRKQDYHTQLQLAKASGLSVAEINKQLDTQDKLSKLTTTEREKAEKAIEQGLDITKIDQDQLALETEKFAKQQEQQATLEQISNQFMGIVATLGADLVPLLELALTPVILMANGLNSIVGFVREYSDILSVVAIVMGTIFGIQKGIVLFQRREAVLRLLSMKRAAAMAALSALSNPAKALAGLAAAAIVVGVASSFTSKAGDISSPADGKTMVSTKEGGLFELSPNDDLVAAPGAAAALANQNKTQSINVQSVGSPAETLNGSNNLLEPTNSMVTELKGLREDISKGVGKSQKIASLLALSFLGPIGILLSAGLGAAASENNETTATAGGDVNKTGDSPKSTIDFSVLSAPLNSMINEIKGLRADMSSGKIAVYMDTSKVTSKIAKQVDASTRNNFNLGQAQA